MKTKKCTWVGCEEEAHHDMKGLDGTIWASLCSVHYAKHEVDVEMATKEASLDRTDKIRKPPLVVGESAGREESLIMMDKPVNLAGIEYLVTEADGQVIFKCNDGMSATTFALEWTGCGWYLVALNDHFERIFARHITSALEWVEKNYAIMYNDGVGTATLR